MRPIDLATSAGVSTQQVRNLESGGVLPPAERTTSGYRVYRDEHLSALHCYQALVHGHGAESARQIMSSIATGEIDRALELIDASHADLQQQRQALNATAKAVSQVTEAVGSQPDRSEPLSIGQLARILEVRTSTLRVWEHAGLLTPARQTSQRHRLYEAADIRDARVIRLLRQGHYLFDHIRPVMEEFRAGTTAGTLRAALKERRAALTSRSRAMLHGAALVHQHLDALGRGGFASLAE